MALFIGRVSNKVDAKGRVSVPAAFRNALGDALSDGVVLSRPANGLECIEAAPMAQLTDRHRKLSTLNQLTEVTVALQTMLLGDVRPVTFDKEGRVNLPDDLKDEIGIKTEAVFVGIGDVFQIWEPRAFELHFKRCKAIAQANLHLLDPKPAGDAGADQ